MDFKAHIQDYLNKEIDVINRLDLDAINEVMNLLEDARQRGARIYTCGNGGSAATASHFVTDFNKGVTLHRTPKFRFYCVNDNVPSITASANDICWEDAYLEDLKCKLEKGDILLGISGSGNSKNILKCMEYAKEVGAISIGLSGYNGGKLKEMCDYSLHVPIDNMQIVEDVHMIFDHLISYIFQQTLA